MKTGRLEAFSDGVIAIIITIMVLEIKVPHTAQLTALKPLFPTILSYLLSFIYLGIYWNNHHHMIHVAERVNGRILWANLHLLFWLSLVPFTTAWMGENNFAPATMFAYGIVLLMAAIAYYILELAILKQESKNSILAKALGKDFKGKISPIIYIIAICTTYYNQWLSGSLYILVALIWLIPDRRIEKALEDAEKEL